MVNYRRYKKQIGCYASEDLSQQLVKLAEKRHQKISEVVRYAIEKLIKDDKERNYETM